MSKMDYSDLIEIEEQVKARFIRDSERILMNLNRTGNLEEFLKLVDMSDLLGEVVVSWRQDGRIIVIGQAAVSKEHLLGVAKEFGLDKTRFEFCLEYNDAKSYNFKRTQYNQDYSCILAGPMPHQGNATGDFSSILTAIENQEGYPRVVRMGTNELKITKSSFRSTLQYLIREGVVTP